MRLRVAEKVAEKVAENPRTNILIVKSVDQIRFVLVLISFVFSLKSFAHENHEGDTGHFSLVQYQTLSNYVFIEETNDHLIIKSNGIPSHATGNFPNRGNPHRITAQRHNLRVPKHPQKTGSAISSKHFGIAVNGVMFVPGTAECWGRERQRPPANFNARPPKRPPPSQPRLSNNRECDWREEAIIGSTSRLGLDDNFGHVQPNGMYHYHGVPYGLMRQQKHENNKDLVFLGYAADGYKIQASKASKYKSSFQLKSGNRTTGPKGRFDGSYTADFEYVRGSGDLDECNGLLTAGNQYFYILTNEFPFVPRCWKGQPDKSFLSFVERIN